MTFVNVKVLESLPEAKLTFSKNDLHILLYKYLHFLAAILACENRNCSKHKPNSTCHPVGTEGKYECRCNDGFFLDNDKCLGMWYLFSISMSVKILFRIHNYGLKNQQKHLETIWWIYKKLFKCLMFSLCYRWIHD